MKTVTTVLSLLASTSAALAHTAAAPHTHHGNHVSWIPAIACTAVVGAAVYLALRLRKSRKSR